MGKTHTHTPIKWEKEQYFMENITDCHQKYKECECEVRIVIGA